MGKSKPPDNPGSGVFNQGLAAYRRVLKPEAAPPKEADSRDEDALVKALPPPLPPGLLKQAPGEGDSKYRRVAKFLVLIGGDEAAKILSNLDQEQVEAISLEIASIRGITQEEAEEIFREFRSLLTNSYAYSGGAQGGVEAARRILYAAFGPEKGETLLRKAAPHVKEKLFDFLEDFSGEQIAFLLREESPGMAALVLSRLAPNVTASALANLPPGKKSDIVLRIARINQSTPEVLKTVAEGLREKARRFSEAGGLEGSADIDGRGVLAEILKHSDISFEDRILNELEEMQPDLGRELKDRLYTLDDVAKADDRAVQEKLRTMSDRDIAILIKGRSQEFEEKILGNMTANRRAQVRDERVILGAIPKKDAEPVAQAFLAWFREGRENGEILLSDDEDVAL